MEWPNWMKRAIVWVCRIKPKVFSAEEKKAWCEKTAADNRAQDRDITACPGELIDGLTMEAVPLSNASAWMVTKPDNPQDKVIYYIHGGGFIGACTKARMPFVSVLAKRFGYNVFSLDYRLAPEYPHPCQLDDCLDGYMWLLDRFASENIVLIGESAGGTLVLTLSLLLRDRQLPLPKAIYANSPATQLAEYTNSYRKFSLKEDFIVTEGIIENMYGVYIRQEEAKEPYVSPLYGDLHGLPPITLTASECECLLDDSKMLYDKLLAAQNEAQLLTYPGLCHAFIISPQMKRVVRDAYPDLDTWLRKHLG